MYTTKLSHRVSRKERKREREKPKEKKIVLLFLLFVNVVLVCGRIYISRVSQSSPSLKVILGLLVKNKYIFEELF